MLVWGRAWCSARPSDKDMHPRLHVAHPLAHPEGCQADRSKGHSVEHACGMPTFVPSKNNALPKRDVGNGSERSDRKRRGNSLMGWEEKERGKARGKEGGKGWEERVKVIHTPIHAYIHMCIHICIYTCAYTYAYTHAHIHTQGSVNEIHEVLARSR